MLLDAPKISLVNNVVFWEVMSCGSCKNRQGDKMIYLRSVLRLLVTTNLVPSTPLLVTVMLEAVSSSVHLILQEPRCVPSQKMAFFIVTAVKTSNPTYFSVNFILYFSTNL
jgi:hypothetical protein